MDSTGGLPVVNRIGVLAPFGWLAGAAGDMREALLPCLIYGLALALLSLSLSLALLASNAAFWALTLTCGFVFIAPMLAMGLYEAGRLIETGKSPTLRRMMFVRSAIRQDVAYLGLALLLIYLFWGRIAQVVYGLSTYRLHRSIEEFAAFAISTAEGHATIVAGTLVGGVIAYFTYCLVVISAPMLLDSRTNVLAATITSLRAVTHNFIPMSLWAALIAILTLASAATGFLALIVVFPWLGLASWRAYRALVPAVPASSFQPAQ